MVTLKEPIHGQPNADAVPLHEAIELVSRQAEIGGGTSVPEAVPIQRRHDVGDRRCRLAAMPRGPRSGCAEVANIHAVRAI